MPHVCGDEPEMQALNVLHSGVCPTYVGMNRPTVGRTTASGCMPHVCGDEPYYLGAKKIDGLYAPRMWG